MTSRREFFGLLAAAPLVAPVVVKEMGATINSVRAASGFEPIRHLKIADGEVIWHRPWQRVSPTIRNAKPGQYHFDVPTHLDMEDGRQIFAIGDCIIQPLEPDVLTDEPGYCFKPNVSPNRLYGTQINADGEAV
jgi:hypothetical protein